MMDDKNNNFLPVGYLLSEYRIEKVLEQSDNSIFYLALDMNIERKVVIKEYFPEALAIREDDFSLSVKESHFSDQYVINLSKFLDEVKQIANLPAKEGKGVRVMRCFSVNSTGYMVAEHAEEKNISVFLDILKTLFDQNALFSGQRIEEEKRSLPIENNETKEVQKQRENQDHKIIIYGSVGADNTAALNTLCNKVITRDVNDHMLLDYGNLNISSSEKVRFYSVHRQDTLKSAWKMTYEKLLGVVFLIDNRRKDPLRDLEEFYLNLPTQNTKNIVIGITHIDRSRIPAISDYHAHINSLGISQLKKAPIFSIDTKNYQDMSMLVQALLYSLDPSMMEEKQSEETFH